MFSASLYLGLRVYGLSFKVSLQLENKALLMAQPLPQSEESMCKQQALGNLLCSASCSQLAALLKSLDTTLCSCLGLLQTWGFSGYRFLPYLCLAQLERQGFAFTFASLGQQH